MNNLKKVKNAIAKELHKINESKQLLQEGQLFCCYILRDVNCCRILFDKALGKDGASQVMSDNPTLPDTIARQALSSLRDSEVEVITNAGSEEEVPRSLLRKFGMAADRALKAGGPIKIPTGTDPTYPEFPDPMGETLMESNGLAEAPTVCGHYGQSHIYCINCCTRGPGEPKCGDCPDGLSDAGYDKKKFGSDNDDEFNPNPPITPTSGKVASKPIFPPTGEIDVDKLRMQELAGINEKRMGPFGGDIDVDDLIDRETGGKMVSMCECPDGSFVPTCEECRKPARGRMKDIPPNAACPCGDGEMRPECCRKR